MTWRALDHLQKAHLLEERIEVPSGARRVSRRELLRKSSLAAGLLPIVVSLVVPTAAIAGNSCGAPGCIASSACRAGIDTCKCCGPPSCVKRCDAGGVCSNAASGC